LNRTKSDIRTFMTIVNISQELVNGVRKIHKHWYHNGYLKKIRCNWCQNRYQE